MTNMIENYSLFVVRSAIARYLERKPTEVVASDILGADLGLGLFDIAVVAMRLEDELEIELRLTALDELLTVEELSEIVAGLVQLELDRVA